MADVSDYPTLTDDGRWTVHKVLWFGLVLLNVIPHLIGIGIASLIGRIRGN